jgi:hypothetical protein
VKTAAALLALAAMASAAWAQDPFAVPSDARGLIARHAELAAAEPTATTEAARFLAYYRCGALAEAREAVEALARIDPADPDARRFGLLLDSHEPERLARTLEGCERFLAEHAADARVSPAARSAVESLRDWLLSETEHRAAMAAATTRARLSPLLGLAGCLVLVLLLARARGGR